MTHQHPPSQIATVTACPAQHGDLAGAHPIIKCDLPHGHPGEHRNHIARTSWSRAPVATTELDAVHAGLEPEQECRARALEACSRMRWDEPFADTADVCDVAEQLAAWIRDGSHPDGSRFWTDETREWHP